MNKHTAIYKTHPTVVTIRGDEAFNAEGNAIPYDQAAVQAYIDAHAYIAKRQTEYPSFIDYLDGVVKEDQAQVQAYIDACNAVKTKYPKG